ncbi:MAG: aspartate aminotransferase family protein [Gammaproteobacteria bacterium]|nr:aspartate aminotransferase family protein [Gammaproteobacteria bacterium]MYD75338.1 aspartate aminotransferase family protein [Gammaproteobacteria bacterium]MYJ51430.1 aspartate aminotransferase family protein [Gammaproteobacteria bacterium]
MRTYDTSALQDLDHKHYYHPFTNHPDMWSKGAHIITEAENVYIYDSDGNRYLDAMSGLWCVNIGYGRNELAETAKLQMEQLPYYNSFFQTAQLPAVELAEMLASVTPAGLNRTFFGCSGSDANDTIVRLVRHFWSCQGHPDRNVIVSRKNAYHGSTIAGSSLGGMSSMHAQGGLPIPNIRHINQPYFYREGGDMTPEEFGLERARELEKTILELGPDRVAAFIGEPIQGAGGVIIPPDSYWPEINRICQKYDVLLCADEVICGFGRTGNWFGTDTFGIAADIMSMAKGLSSGYQPISAVVISDRIGDVLDSKGGEFTHGYTYSGHPVACAVALKNLEIMRDERIIETARENTQDYLQSKVALLNRHPLVGEARGCGFLGALELVRNPATGERYDDKGTAGKTCRDIAIGNGLVMRAIGDIMVFCPPLIISRDQIDELYRLILKTLDQTQDALNR